MESRIRYADGQLDDVASVLCAAHPRVSQYLEQAPVLAMLACEKFGSHVTYGEVDRFSILVASEPRLKTIMAGYAAPQQARIIDAKALRLSDRSILKAIFALPPSTLAQIIPPASAQRSWLHGLSKWLKLDGKHSALCDLAWLARRFAEDQSRIEQVDQLFDWLTRGGGRVDPKQTWAQALAGVERWHLSLRSERELRQMLADKAAAARYDSIICRAPVPDVVVVDDYTFVALRTPRALRDEGATMHHCVGSYDRHVEEGGSAILSIRREGVNIATLQLSRLGKVVQIKAHCNQAPSAAVRAAAELYALTQWKRDDAAKAA